MRVAAIFWLSWCFFLFLPAMAMEMPVPDVPFDQEFHVPYPLADEAQNEVRSVAVDGAGQIWAATRAGVYVLPKGEKVWRAMLDGADAGPAFDVFVAKDGVLWAGAWNGAYRSADGQLERVAPVEGPVAAIGETSKGLVLLGPNGMWMGDGTSFAGAPLTTARSVRRVLAGPEDALWVCTGGGLYNLTHSRLYQEARDILSCSVFDAAYANDGKLWVGGLGGVTIYERGHRVADLTPKSGLPTIYVQAVERDAQGRMWVGTTLGIARYDGGRWSIRNSRRWLVNDDVRDLAFDADGNAWIATAGGVSALMHKPETLADKGNYFQHLAETRHTRPPGFVEKVRLETPGDYETWQSADDDNDGEYTSMYLVSQSYRYAATKDEAARQSAKSAFDALKYLQTVTETPGFVARTVIPKDWARMHDANETFTEQERAERLVQEPRFKPVEQRWRPSADGQWLWKGDTSSDEITGHFWAYGYYYDLVADDAEKAAVREHVRRIMDYIIAHGYVLMDIDGAHTRWGVWAPERLNGDPDWAAERGINSAEILSYLKTTYHMTGDEKYQREYLRLLNDEGYRENVKRAKTFDAGWRTHIDDELLALVWPGLLRYEEDRELRRLYLDSMERWYRALEDNKSPFFNFVYAELTSGEDKNHEDSIAFLRDAPLDLVNWTVDNSHREDLTLVRNPNIEPLQTEEVLPPSERGVVRWDKNPFEALQGDGGHTAWAPTFWLLPYWQGRYLNLIAAPGGESWK